MRLLVRLRVDLDIAALRATLFKEPISSQERHAECAAIRRAALLLGLTPFRSDTRT